jgi:hypothetical protein
MLVRATGSMSAFKSMPTHSHLEVNCATGRPSNHSESARAAANTTARDRDCQMGFSRAGSSDQHDIALLGEASMTENSAIFNARHGVGSLHEQPAPTPRAA